MKRPVLEDFMGEHMYSDSFDKIRGQYITALNNYIDYLEAQQKADIYKQLEEMIMSTPNDSQLGAKIRKEYFKRK